MKYFSYRVLLALDECQFADAVVAALKTAKFSHPNLRGAHITVRGPYFEDDQETSVEGDNHCAGDELASIVFETIDREKQKGKP